LKAVVMGGFGMDIITTEGDGFFNLDKRRFYIDCLVDVEMHDAEIRRIEIPRELAKYITKLQTALKEIAETDAFTNEDAKDMREIAKEALRT